MTTGAIPLTGTTPTVELVFIRRGRTGNLYSTIGVGTFGYHAGGWVGYVGSYIRLFTRSVGYKNDDHSLDRYCATGWGRALHVFAWLVVTLYGFHAVHSG